MSRRFLGTNIVVFRTQNGRVAATEAHCPHLGAHLGRGRIVGESIECPFHGFRFDGGGRCVATGYGTKPPPKASLRSWPVDEKNGFVLAYHGPEGAPRWTIPELDWEGWSPLLTRVFHFRGHPQETSENSVDLGHFSVTHGYESVEEIRTAEVEGPRLSAEYRVRRPIKIAARRLGSVPVRFAVTVHGLGYSTVESMTAPGIRLRHFVLACPTETEEVELRVGIRIERIDRQRARTLRAVQALGERMVQELAFRAFCEDVEQDLPNWTTKRYVPRPSIAQGDGPIALYRRWASQFYPDDAGVRLQLR